MADNQTNNRVKRLERHLRQENPVLADAVRSFGQLDDIAGRLGLLGPDDSYATHISWWPVIAVLGTFSAGKSTFLNQYAGQPLQRTGNQAVDDKFTVVCYGPVNEAKLLPGSALDRDPRFPFFQISRGIESVAEGEGRRVDSYLQLKTAEAEPLRGKIFIDSPGFDADQQRTSTLLITDYIIDLSDLVLVFFDARHPEPGAMGDTLEHLVAGTVKRPDANKFLYILNQIDTTAREDNPEEVVAAWQRALAGHGLTAGRFYRIYAREAAVQVEDPQVRERLERQRDADLAEIEGRIHEVEVERAYRVVDVLEKCAKRIRDELVPRLTAARRAWLRRSLALNSVVFGVLIVAALVWSIKAQMWDGLKLIPLAELSRPLQAIVVIAVLAIIAYVAGKLRHLAGLTVLSGLRRDPTLEEDTREALLRGFHHNLEARWHWLAKSAPRGWSARARRRLDEVLADADRLIQSLNDKYAKPSGGAGEQG